jgi:CRP-like cAMP-binding protein
LIYLREASGLSVLDVPDPTPPQDGSSGDEPAVQTPAARDPSITDAERQALHAAVSHEIEIAADTEIVREHQVVDCVHLMSSGWACRYATLPAGGGGIQSLHLGGDFIDLQGFTLKHLDYSAVALTRLPAGGHPHDGCRPSARPCPT